MSLKVMNDNNINILSREDANHYYTLSGYTKHFVSNSYGSKFSVTMTGLTAKLGSGQGSVYGRHIINDGELDISCQLPINSDGYLVLSLDLTKPAGSELTFSAKSILNQEDLVNKGTRYDMPLYRYITNTSTTTKFEDVRVYFDGIINTDKIANGGVTTGKIADSGITTSKIADSGVTTGKIANKAVTADKIDNSVFLKIYPIGAIYISTTNTNPSTLFGGTWATFATGSTIVGVDTSQTEFSTVSKTGGSKTHAHGSTNTSNGTLEAAIGTTSSNTSELGYVTSNYNNVSIVNSVYGVGGSYLGSKAFNHWTRIYGATASTNSLPPYITVYMWKRTA